MAKEFVSNDAKLLTGLKDAMDRLSKRDAFVNMGAPFKPGTSIKGMFHDDMTHTVPENVRAAFNLVYGQCLTLIALNKP